MANKHSKKTPRSQKHHSSTNPHRSFRRSYREDYYRETKLPSITQHIFSSFKIMLDNWKIFAMLVGVAVLLNILLVGLISGDTYQQLNNTIEQSGTQMAGGDIGNMAKAWLILISTITTGGLAGDSDAARLCSLMIFLILWLTTIFLLRHKMAGQKVSLRDGLYNAMTPLISTFVVLAVVIVECMPIFLLVVAYSAAIQTEFLTMPFYALVFFVFAALMIVISGYLLSSTLIALVAITAPGLYPLKALRAASDIMIGRKMNFIARLIALALALGILWVVIMLPLIAFDLWIKNYEWAAGIPFIPVCLNIMTCISIVYSATYLYRYYRWLIDED